MSSSSQVLRDRTELVFSGIRFVLFGFDSVSESQYRAELIRRGGVDVGQDDPTCTHVLVSGLVYDDPICIAARNDRKTLVTELWIEDSVDFGKLADATRILYRPLKELNGIPGSDVLHICLTGYQRQERDDIMKMVELMGAHFSKPLIANKVTHLICYKFEGEKYDLAKKVNIELANHRWLEDCLKAWKILPTENYSKSGWEVEVLESQAKDSEDEAEDETARPSIQRSTTQCSSLPKDKFGSPVLPMQSGEAFKVPKNMEASKQTSYDAEDIFTSNTLLSTPCMDSSYYGTYHGYGNGKVTETADHQGVGGGPGGIQQSPNNCTMIDSINGGDVFHMQSPIIKLKTEGNEPSLGVGDVRGSHLAAAEEKLTYLNGSRKAPKKTMLPEDLSSDLHGSPQGTLLQNNIKVGMDVSPLAPKLDSSGSDSITLQITSTNFNLHLRDGSSSVLPQKRKVAIPGNTHILPSSVSHNSKAHTTPSLLATTRSAELETPAWIDANTIKDDHHIADDNAPFAGVEAASFANYDADASKLKTLSCNKKSLSVYCNSKAQTTPTLSAITRSVESETAMLIDENCHDQQIASDNTPLLGVAAASFTANDVDTSKLKALNHNKKSLSVYYDSKAPSSPTLSATTRSAKSEMTILIDGEKVNSDRQLADDNILFAGVAAASSLANHGVDASKLKLSSHRKRPLRLGLPLLGIKSSNTVLSPPSDQATDFHCNNGLRRAVSRTSTPTSNLSALETRTSDNIVSPADDMTTVSSDYIQPKQADGPSISNAAKHFGVLAIDGRQPSNTSSIEKESVMDFAGSKESKMAMLSDNFDISMKVVSNVPTKDMGQQKQLNERTLPPDSWKSDITKLPKSVSPENLQLRNAETTDVPTKKLVGRKKMCSRLRLNAGKTNKGNVSAVSEKIKCEKATGDKQNVVEIVQEDVLMENNLKVIPHSAKCNGDRIGVDMMDISTNSEKENEHVEISRLGAKLVEHGGINAEFRPSGLSNISDKNVHEAIIAEKHAKIISYEPACFILSGHRLQKKEFQVVIRRLGGRVCRDSHNWSSQATHFIVPDPVRRTEKFFAAAAAGRWILKTDYLTASNEDGKFVAEEPFEWYKKGLTEDDAINLEAPRKWRHLRERTGHGALYGLRIIIHGECIAPSLDTLRRVVKAGDGTILATSPPYTRYLKSGVDFAILSRAMPQVDMWVQEFLKNEIPCVLADYLVGYVCKPGHSLKEHVLFDTHAWAEKSYANLLSRSEEVVSRATAPSECEDDDLSCAVCGSRDRGKVMLICGDEKGSKGCGIGTHIDCCDPPLEAVPKEDWFCSSCCQTKNTGDTPPKGKKKGKSLSKRR